MIQKKNARIDEGECRFSSEKIEYSGIDLVREESRKAKGLFEKKFGPMPDFEKTSVC